MRRFLFWSLCFCLLFPVGLSSCDGSDSAAVIFGGTTGELTWTLTEDGVLTITGEGPMPDYRDGGTSETPPWYPHVNRISSLTIGEGVTRIGDYAFMLCSFVTEVVIPESVTSMGDWAFWHCQSLYLEPHNNQKQSEISKRKSLITNTFYKLTLFGCFLSLPKFPHIFDTYFWRGEFAELIFCHIVQVVDKGLQPFTISDKIRTDMQQ